MIVVDNLKKSYRVPIKEEGITGAVKNLFHRKYDTVEAVKGISFEIEKGEFIGYLGPNGSGKTTMLKMLSGILHPDSGYINIDGFEPIKRQKEFQKNFSIVLGQKNQLEWDLSALESFDLNRAIYEIEHNEYKKRLGELIEIMNAKEIVKKPVRNLSLGERMKMELLGSMLHNPKLLFLDEPTIGLDFMTQKNIREYLKFINSEYNTTVILTSHYMKDIEELCSRLLVVNKGNLAYDGDINSLRTSYTEKKFITLKHSGIKCSDHILQFGRVENETENEISIIADPKNIDSLLNELTGKYSIEDLKIANADVEEVLGKMFNEEKVAS